MIRVTSVSSLLFFLTQHQFTESRSTKHYRLSTSICVFYSTTYLALLRLVSGGQITSRTQW
uniref:Uncharacterized protein n=1 Tax=Octopus bimaculoides TaxID=37653 RepID=A0A0L8HCW5_OCTBM